MKEFDVIVIGGGHAGVEACAASAHLGMKTLLLTLNKKMIANTPCNPHVGGSAKGIVVREVDALGGLMGLLADHHPLQIKMLNTGKGPGVQCLRAQVDKEGYPAYAQEVLSHVENLTIEEGEVVSLLHDDKKVFGVKLSNGEEIHSKATIITTGTYMESSIITGPDVHDGGPDGEKASHGLSPCLKEMGLDIIRLKTGTPPRIDKDTIDFSNAKIQPGMPGELAFSYATKTFVPVEDQLPCYLIYTNEETHKVISDNFALSSVLNGTIKGKGPRYCPSIESKLVRFPDKVRHQLFLEPETEFGNSIYLQGFSTGLPTDIQEKMVHTLPGLEHAKILKYAYQIEYDAIDSLEFEPSLKIKKYEGLYGAGQIVGTSGYEEAAGLGLMAGINASLAIKGEEPFILGRDEAYIGVMIDDLTTKGTDEPYRLLSSRAEYRLLLRHDNADKRLSEYGYKLGLLSKERYEAFVNKYEKIAQVKSILEENNCDRETIAPYLIEKTYMDTDIGHKGIELLKRPWLEYRPIAKAIPALNDIHLDDSEVLSLETEVKCGGYIEKEKREAAYLHSQEKLKLPEDLRYDDMDGLRLEAREKLNKVSPKNIGQASRIPGVNPADISVLLLILKKRKLI